MKAIQKNKKTENDHTRLAHDGIRQLLFSNEITPGQKLSYRMIAERLGMSLTPVVQALKILEFQGLVRHTKNKGYYTEPLSLQEIEEIYESREVIEVSLLPKVVEHLDVDNIIKLKNLIEKQDIKDIDLNTRLIADRDFHITLASISKRRIQIQMLQNLFDILYLKYRGAIIFKDSHDCVGSQHKALFEAVISRDLSTATTAMKQHFDTVKKKALSNLSQLLVAGN